MPAPEDPVLLKVKLLPFKHCVPAPVKVDVTVPVDAIVIVLVIAHNLESLTVTE